MRVTSLSRAEIETLASIQRNLQDYARIDPRVSQTDKERGEISVGGQNSRYNKITIDGVNISDTFGLEAKHTAHLEAADFDRCDSIGASQRVELRFRRPVTPAETSMR